jgi:hypothetical protein
MSLYTNGHADKGEEDAARAAILRQLNGRVAQLKNGILPDPAPEPEPDKPVPVTRSTLPRFSLRQIKSIIAAEANASIGLVNAAFRLAASGNVVLIVLVMLGLLPITTALRAATPPKPNARHERWQRLLELCK